MISIIFGYFILLSIDFNHIYISIYDRVGTKSGEENNSDLTGSVSALLINLLLDEEENLFGSFGKV